MRPQGLEVGGHGTLTHRAAELSAQLQPHAVDDTGRELRRIGIGYRPDSVCTGHRVGPRKTHTQRVLKIGFEAGAVIAAIGIGQRHAGLYLHACQWRLNMHPRHFVGCIGHKVQQKRFVAQQQRIWRGVVGAQGLAIKATRVLRWNLKSAAVQNHVALDFLNAHALQAPQDQPDLFHPDFGVALAANVNIALQHALADHAIQRQRCSPGEGRAEQVQRCAGGHQLHQRRGVALHIGLVQKSRRLRVASPQRDDHHTQSIAGDGGLAQSLFNLGRQGICRKRSCKFSALAEQEQDGQE